MKVFSETRRNAFPACIFVMTIVSSIIIDLRAETLTVATAANFQPVISQVADSFLAHTGNRVVITSASTGSLLSQILNGAPYDLFLAADTEAIHTLVKKENTVAGSVRTYAFGKLVAVSKNIRDTVQLVNALKNASRIGLALPSIAPYGKAAHQFIEHLQLWKMVSAKCVYAQSIGQCYQLVRTDNVAIAFVAFSSLKASSDRFAGVWLIDSTLYDPIEQRLVVINSSTHTATAKVLADYLLSSPMRRLVASFGYTLPQR